MYSRKIIATLKKIYQLQLFRLFWYWYLVLAEVLFCCSKTLWLKIVLMAMSCRKVGVLDGLVSLVSYRGLGNVIQRSYED